MTPLINKAPELMPHGKKVTRFVLVWKRGGGFLISVSCLSSVSVNYNLKTYRLVTKIPED